MKEAPQSQVRLSVIMPAYNEEDLIADAVSEVLAEILPLVTPSELIVVNGGSTDRTGAILDELQAEDARVRVMHKSNADPGSADHPAAD